MKEGNNKKLNILFQTTLTSEILYTIILYAPNTTFVENHCQKRTKQSCQFLILSFEIKVIKSTGTRNSNVSSLASTALFINLSVYQVKKTILGLRNKRSNERRQQKKVEYIVPNNVDLGNFKHNNTLCTKHHLCRKSLPKKDKTIMSIFTIVFRNKCHQNHWNTQLKLEFFSIYCIIYLSIYLSIYQRKKQFLDRAINVAMKEGNNKKLKTNGFDAN